MTWEDFRTYVYDMSKTNGQPFIAWDETAKLDTFLLRRLRLFCAETKCVRRDKVAFTMDSDSDGRFDLRDTTVFALPMCDISQVVVDSGTLIGPDLRLGAYSVNEIERYVSDYRTASEGKPARWALLPPHTLLLVPAPSQVYTNSFVSGWALQPEPETESQELIIAEEDTDAAAYDAAFALMFPLANGESLEKAKNLKSLADQMKKDVTARHLRRLRGTQRRSSDRLKIHTLN